DAPHVSHGEGPVLAGWDDLELDEMRHELGVYVRGFRGFLRRVPERFWRGGGHGYRSSRSIVARGVMRWCRPRIRRVASAALAYGGAGAGARGGAWLTRPARGGGLR